MKTAQFVSLTLVSVLSLLVFVRSVSAAAPDGSGPWADTVTAFSQGLTKDGSAIPALRSDPSAALGVAEDDTAEGHFVSLGFGGVLTLRFDNPVRTGVLVFEATNPNYPVEKAAISVSADGTNWTSAGTVSQDGQVSLPESVSCARYVKITDISVKDDFVDGSADAYDVDGVKAVGTVPCNDTTPTPTPTPTGCGSDSNVVISGNGAGSVNKVIKNSSNSTSVSVGVSSKVKNMVKTKSVTGNNKAKNNTGGGVTITSGSSIASTTVETVFGSTSVSVTNSCCSCGSTCTHNVE